MIHGFEAYLTNAWIRVRGDGVRCLSIMLLRGSKKLRKGVGRTLLFIVETFQGQAIMASVAGSGISVDI